LSNTILTWQEVITATVELAGNKEQNAHIPPYIASNAGRLVTDFCLNEIARIYPNNNRIVDKGRPFLKRKLVEVVNGLATMPPDYRNILSVSIATTDKMDAPCDCKNDCDQCDEEGIKDDTNGGLYENGQRTEPCKYREVKILTSSEYDLASMSRLRPPSYEKPIGMFVDRTTFKVCPREVTYIEVRYLKHPVKSEIGYKMMPDDTWQIDTASPSYVELEWERNIFPEFFKAFTSLYALHTRDGNLVNWNNQLKEIGIF